MLAAVRDPEDVLQSILEVAARTVPADRALLFMLNPLTGSLELAAHLGLREESLDDAIDISLGTLRQAAAGRRVLALDAQTDAALREHRSIARFGIRSILCVPLTLMRDTLGVLYLDSRQRGPLFSAEDLEFLEVFAQQAALAVDMARCIGRIRGETAQLLLDTDQATERFGIIGRSRAIRNLWATIERVAPYSMPVLVHGETGTGKELVSRAIHAHGNRRQAPFLAENCAALPETLLESQLFGHVRGAFTGADRDHRGLFDLAHGGTLFLDEVSEMAPGVQARLLRALQEGEIRPVGSEQRHQVDVRVIAATNRDPQAAIEQGQLREDLYYRLAAIRIEIPPVREHREDIPLLFSHFMERAARNEGRSAHGVDPRVWKYLVRYDWPGNVREIENEARRLCLLCRKASEFTVDDLERYDCVALSPLASSQGDEGPVGPLENSEKTAILRALRACSGNRERAARLLGISRATLFRKIRHHHLQA